MGVSRLRRTLASPLVAVANKLVHCIKGEKKIGAGDCSMHRGEFTDHGAKPGDAVF
jgi:hypothetical protein